MMIIYYVHQKHSTVESGNADHTGISELTSQGKILLIELPIYVNFVNISLHNESYNFSR